MICSPISLAGHSRSEESITMPSASFTICFHLAHANRPLFTSAQQSGQDLLAIEPFTAAVLLHDHVRDFVDPLVGGETVRISSIRGGGEWSLLLCFRANRLLCLSKPQNGHFMDERRRGRLACSSIVTGGWDLLRERVRTRHAESKPSLDFARSSAPVARGVGSRRHSACRFQLHAISGKRNSILDI